MISKAQLLSERLMTLHSLRATSPQLRAKQVTLGERFVKHASRTDPCSQSQLLCQSLSQVPSQHSPEDKALFPPTHPPLALTARRGNAPPSLPRCAARGQEQKDSGTSCGALTRAGIPAVGGTQTLPRCGSLFRRC